jgi:hypothetical protein
MIRGQRCGTAALLHAGVAFSLFERPWVGGLGSCVGITPGCHTSIMIFEDEGTVTTNRPNGTLRRESTQPSAYNWPFDPSAIAILDSPVDAGPCWTAPVEPLKIEP